MNFSKIMGDTTFGISYRGQVRWINEDRKLIRSMGNERMLLAVADGLGGGAGGTEAAEIAITCLNQIKIDAKDLSRSLCNAIQAADAQIRWIVSQNDEMEGMGSTVTAVVVDRDHAHWAHVGDSRLYRLRSGELTQITTDQNMAQFLVEEGQLTVEEARLHPSQNQLDQCIGCGDCCPDTGRFDLETGDLLILTTDGMHGGIPHADFVRLICQEADLAAKGQALAQAALDAGGIDNITLVMRQI